MELHIAIKNLVKYKNKDFINEPQFINALVDFNAFENYPSLRNITRILLSDGYGRKIMSMSSWDMQAQTLVSDIARDYSFDMALVEYVLKSIAYGIGNINDVTPPSSNSSAQRGPQPSSPTPSSPTRSRLTLKSRQIDNLDEEAKFRYKEDAENYIESIIERKGNWENDLKAKFRVSPFFDTGDGSFQLQIEIDGKIRNREYLTFVAVAYNDQGKTLVSEDAYCNVKLPYQVIETGWFSTSEIRNVGNVARIVMYWKED